MKPIYQFIVLGAASAVLQAALAENLYQESAFRPLVSDKRPHRPGDALTVLIFENSSAMTQADASQKRSTEVGARGGIDGRSHAAVLGFNNDFDGGGTVQRTGKLLGQITATVTGIAPNGDLWLSGEQVVTINDDSQQIRVEGRVRTLDISDANTVLSSRLADARISYLGSGPVENSKKPGLLSALFSWLGL